MGKISNVVIYTNKISKNMHLLVVSDIHATKTSGYKNLTKIKDIMSTEPIDHIIIPGDIVDDVESLKDYNFQKKLQSSLLEFTQEKPTIISYGNHDQMTKKDGIWQEGNKQLLKDTLSPLPNYHLLENGEIFKTDVFDVANLLNASHPCYICARMRRGYLYDYAQKLGCNKIALAHHFDDVLETILLSLFYSGSFKTMMPKVKSTNFKGMELIRPLYFVREDDIISWAQSNNLTFLNCGCKFVLEKKDSKRSEIKALLKELRKTNPFIEKNIFRSTERVNVQTILSYIDLEGKEKTILEEEN